MSDGKRETKGEKTDMLKRANLDAEELDNPQNEESGTAVKSKKRGSGRGDVGLLVAVRGEWNKQKETKKTRRKKYGEAAGCGQRGREREENEWRAKKNGRKKKEK